MASPLEGALKRTIGKAFERVFLPATLQREEPGTPNPDAPWEPVVPITRSYPCRAIVETYSDFYRAQELVTESDRKVLVLAASLAVEPVAGDRVQIGGKTYTVVEIATDPAGATWTLRAMV